MITVNRAEYLSALTCAGVKDVRYYLNGIFFDPEGFIVGTDGHRLFCGKAVTEGESVIINVKAKPPTHQIQPCSYRYRKAQRYFH
ncbi:hypothetical protein AB0132_08575 [Klebsiella quasipneumoniae]|uniref:hypothetical protein n=1 Tax=Klebsiella quasipneumoniae TaxID=1463165 RepID=UPI0034507715